eukprot:RCo042180
MRDDGKAREFLSSLEGCYSSEYGSFSLKYDKGKGKVLLGCAAFQGAYFAAAEEGGELVARGAEENLEVVAAVISKTNGSDLVLDWLGELMELKRRDGGFC